MKKAEDILIEIFDPSPQDCQTCREDLRLAITLNPSLELIEKAINQARLEALTEAANKVGNSGSWIDKAIDKSTILNLIKELK